MRIFFIFLTIGLVFTLVQYTNGAPTRSVPSESDEDDSVEMKVSIFNPIRNNNDRSDESEEDKSVETEVTTTLNPNSDSNDQSDESGETATESKSIASQVSESDQTSEEKMKADEALEFIRNFEKPNSYNIQEDNDDDED